MNELKIIKELYKKKRNANHLDDCFYFDNKYLITTDTICEFTHFKHNWSSPQNIANKLIEVNVSDIAASGGNPKLAFLNMGLSNFSGKNIWLVPFIKEFKNALRKYNIQLVGGDTYKSYKTNLTLTLIGETRKPIFRNTGKIGDFIYLTGSVGLSNMGYRTLESNLQLPSYIKKEAIKKHLHPQARLKFSKILKRKYNINAMMDISDGLFQDCNKLALASELKLEIEINKIPNLKEYNNYIGIDEILSSGEELELLFLSSSKILSLQGCPISCIGQTKKGKPSVEFILNKKKYIPRKKGFLHFK